LTWNESNCDRWRAFESCNRRDAALALCTDLEPFLTHGGVPKGLLSFQDGLRTWSVSGPDSAGNHSDHSILIVPQIVQKRQHGCGLSLGSCNMIRPFRALVEPDRAAPSIPASASWVSNHPPTTRHRTRRCRASCSQLKRPVWIRSRDRKGVSWAAATPVGAI